MLSVKEAITAGMKYTTKNGKMVEESITAQLSDTCVISTDEVYDQKYKIDMVLNKFKGIDKFLNIGVQLTLKVGDISKQREFLRERARKTLVDRCLYIEILPDVDIDAWGVSLIRSALMAFAFQKDLSTQEVLGVRILSGFRYEFFDIEEATRHEMSDSLLHGEIYKWIQSRGFGFLRDSKNISWFFHVHQIVDQGIVEDLACAQYVPYSGATPTILANPIRVAFKDGGVEPGETAPTAINLVRAKD